MQCAPFCLYRQPPEKSDNRKCYNMAKILNILIFNIKSRDIFLHHIQKPWVLLHCYYRYSSDFQPLQWRLYLLGDDVWPTALSEVLGLCTEPVWLFYTQVGKLLIELTLWTGLLLCSNQAVSFPNCCQKLGSNKRTTIWANYTSVALLKLVIAFYTDGVAKL